jgi:hypothetical protein
VAQQESKLEQALRLVREVREERPDARRLLNISRLTSLLSLIQMDLAEAINEQWKEDTVKRVLDKNG